jgi:hypothetical protein
MQIESKINLLKMFKFFSILCIITLSGCVSKQPESKQINVIYCPEINSNPTFKIPKEISASLISRTIKGISYDIIKDSKFRYITKDFYNPIEKKVFESIGYSIFGEPNSKKTNELILEGLHNILFDKKNQLKKYPKEPTSNQIFIYFHKNNQFSKNNDKYYVSNTAELSKTINDNRLKNKDIYIFNLYKNTSQNSNIKKTQRNFEKNTKTIKNPHSIRNKENDIKSNSTFPKLIISPKISDDYTKIIWKNNVKTHSNIYYRITITKKNKIILIKDKIINNYISCSDLNNTGVLYSDCEYNMEISAIRESDRYTYSETYDIELINPTTFSPRCHLNKLND